MTLMIKSEDEGSSTKLEGIRLFSKRKVDKAKKTLFQLEIDILKLTKKKKEFQISDKYFAY